MIGTPQEPPLKITYLKCHKNSLHQGESINMVCLEKTCLENLICCCACVQDQHKQHKVRPLKMVVDEVKKQETTNKPIKINVDIMLDILKSNQARAFDIFGKYKRQIIESLQSTQRTLQNYYDLTADQIILKNSDSNLLIQQALDRASVPKNHQDLKLTVKKLVALVCESNKGKNLSEEELKQSLKMSSQSLQKSIKIHMEDAKTMVSKLQTSLTSFIQYSNLWQINYKFSQKYKHQDIKLVSENRVKAGSTQGYKFALMEPEVDKVGRKTFSFKVKQSKTNWLAVGFCHKKTVEAKNYSFVFGSIGHGGYLISSNGGSWSNHCKQQNNTIKALKFSKNDTIHATIDPLTLTITFTKNNLVDSYVLPYELVNGEDLNPCVLFYYKDDEIEYVGNTSPS